MSKSFQEFATTNNLEREIKAPVKSWRLQTKPINSIVVYKDWLYSASLIVEGSNIKVNNIYRTLNIHTAEETATDQIQRKRYRIGDVRVSLKYQ